jgi:hypothetical protein
MRRIVTVVILALLCSPSSLEAQSSNRPDRTQVLVVPIGFRTIQEAIDAAPDGATIVIMPGVYETVLTVRGKRLHLVGRGNPEIRGPEPNRERIPDLTRATGLINYVAGGGGSLKGVMLTRGDNAIVGFSSEEPPGALEVIGVNVQGAGRAILWCCGPLTVKDSHFSKLLWHGISIPCQGFPLKALFVDGVAIVDSEKAGIYMSNCSGVPSCENNVANNVVKNVSLAFNKGGGILAVNSQLCVQNSNIDFATTAGMIFLGSAAFTRGNDINFTQQLLGVLGDGITSFPWQGVPSQVTVENTTIYHPDRIGLSNFGSHIAVKSTFMVCAQLAAASLLTTPYNGLVDSVDDQGGNKCGCPFANDVCGATAGGAPQPPPPVGGLE